MREERSSTEKMIRAFLTLTILLLITTAGTLLSYCTSARKMLTRGINSNLTLILPSLFHLNHNISEGYNGCLCCTCFNIRGLLGVLHSQITESRVHAPANFFYFILFFLGLMDCPCLPPPAPDGMCWTLWD